jgi:hypothetical protein
MLGRKSSLILLRVTKSRKTFHRKAEYQIELLPCACKPGENNKLSGSKDTRDDASCLQPDDTNPEIVPLGLTAQHELTDISRFGVGFYHWSPDFRIDSHAMWTQNEASVSPASVVRIHWLAAARPGSNH